MASESKRTGEADSGLAEGIFAAALTPQTDRLAVDHDALLEHCNWLIANGCDGICLFGTTGEAASFTIGERVAALEAIVGGGFPPERLLVGTGCCAIADTVTLTKHAVDNGAGGVLVLPPYYYKGVSDEGIVDAHKSIIEGMENARFKFYLYHYPYMSGVSLGSGVIAELVSLYPDTVVGIKDSSGDFENMKMICGSFAHLRTFPGTEALLLDSLKIGAVGCISATINVTSRLAAEIYRRRDEAEVDELQRKLTAIRETFDRYPLIEALKHVMAAHTGREQWRNARPPISRLSSKDGKQLQQELASLGFSIG